MREIVIDGSCIEYHITYREVVEFFGLQPRHLRVFTQERALVGLLPPPSPALRLLP